MPIRILEATVAAKIAAGEVVERPASVVKELVENSLDADASSITIEIQGGGVGLIRVTDNGEGIPVLDLELALERHATSKIASVSDLDSIATMGFRGEALPSIAAVSRLTLTSRVRGTDQGAYIRAKSGIIERKGAVGCPEGTIVLVQDLFASVPARRKFLRSEASEAGRIHRMVAQLATAHPYIRFRLLNNGRETFASPGSGNVRDVLASVYDRQTADALMEVTTADSDGRSLKGFISPPGITRANRSAVSFYVNSRWVLNRLMLQAVEEAYRGLLMEGRHPIISLHVLLQPNEIDVNVHPTKQEVRFHREGAVFSLVQRAVREALVAQSPVPLVAAPRYTPSWHFPSNQAPPSPSQGELALHIVPPNQPEPRSAEDRSPSMPQMLPALRILGQAGNTYIIAEGPEGVYLIDQHAAHERVRYEQVLRQVREQQADTQGLLEPYALEVLPSQIEMLEEWGDVLHAYGFQGETFGERAYLLRGVPAGLKDTNLEALLAETLDILSKAQDTGQAAESLAASIACHSAVRAGDTLTHDEMVALVRQLEAAESPHTCPHGRPTMLHLSTGSLEREFGRR